MPIVSRLTILTPRKQGKGTKHGKAGPSPRSIRSRVCSGALTVNDGLALVFNYPLRCTIHDWLVRRGVAEHLRRVRARRGGNASG